MLNVINLLIQTPMNIDCEQLIQIKYGVPLGDIEIPVTKPFQGSIYKVNTHYYILADEVFDEDSLVRYFGFIWVASEAVAGWIFLNNSYADERVVKPPQCLLPKPDLFTYEAIIDYGKTVDSKNFTTFVIGQTRVLFNEYTFYFRKCEPLKDEFPIAIEVDLRPWRHDNI